MAPPSTWKSEGGAVPSLPADALRVGPEGIPGELREPRAHLLEVRREARIVHVELAQAAVQLVRARVEPPLDIGSVALGQRQHRGIRGCAAGLQLGRQLA